MKKKITLLLGFVCIVCIISAQNVFKLSDFESGTDDCFLGSSSNTAGTNNSITKEVVDNPVVDPVNGSYKVLRIDYPLLTGSTYGVVFSNAIGSNTVTVGTTSPIPIGNGDGEYGYLHFKILKIKSSRVEWQFRNSGGSGAGFSSVVVPGTPEAPEDPDDPYYSKTEDQLWAEASWQDVTIDFMTLSDNCNIPTEITDGTVFYGYMLCLDKANAIGSAFTVYIDDIYLSSSSEPILTSINNTTVKNARIFVAKNLSGNSTVVVNEVTGNLKLEIFNLQGQLIKEIYKGAAVSRSYELPALTGIYILKAITDKGVISIKF